MTANLLAHTDLFRPASRAAAPTTARSRRSASRPSARTFWEAPEVYASMSPFMLRGQDQRADPADPRRGGQQLRHVPDPVRAAVPGAQGQRRDRPPGHPPDESHGYRARESILHVLAEMFDWARRAASRTSRMQWRRQGMASGIAVVLDGTVASTAALVRYNRCRERSSASQSGTDLVGRITMLQRLPAPEAYRRGTSMPSTDEVYSSSSKHAASHASAAADCTNQQVIRQHLRLTHTDLFEVHPLPAGEDYLTPRPPSLRGKGESQAEGDVSSTTGSSPALPPTAASARPSTENTPLPSQEKGGRGVRSCL